MSDDNAGDSVNINVKGLDSLLKALDTNVRARVGILGSKTVRSNSKIGSTNASVGALHEFGSSKMPMRSFLRVPISENLQKRMESSGLLDKDALAEVIKSKTLIPWLKVVAVLAEGIVAEAFETSGFGKWPAWRTPNYKNGNNRLLDDTGQLKDSITSEVK